MRHISKTNKICMALAILCCFVLFFLCSETFIAVNTSHGHDTDETGEQCSVCIHIKLVESIWKQFGIALGIISFKWFVLLTVSSALHYILSLSIQNTLVGLKVRLNN